MTKSILVPNISEIAALQHTAWEELNNALVYQIANKVGKNAIVAEWNGCEATFTKFYCDESQYISKGTLYIVADEYAQAVLGLKVIAGQLYLTAYLAEEDTYCRSIVDLHVNSTMVNVLITHLPEYVECRASDGAKTSTHIAYLVEEFIRTSQLLEQKYQEQLEIDKIVSTLTHIPDFVDATPATLAVYQKVYCDLEYSNPAYTLQEIEQAYKKELQK